MKDTFKIVRYYADDAHGRKTVRTGLTLKEAQDHCNNPETSSRTATSKEAVAHTEQFGDWFDGYVKEMS